MEKKAPDGVHGKEGRRKCRPSLLCVADGLRHFVLTSACEIQYFHTEFNSFKFYNRVLLRTPPRDGRAFRIPHSLIDKDFHVNTRFLW
jgi:hypothetical protein